MNRDEHYMRRALQLARNGYGFTSPNPMVGAVITDADGNVIGEGWHRRYGEAHAEVNAVASVADKSLLREATIYVTLEPCSHYGKTPPCAELLRESGFRRVVIGCRDPFPEVSGRGIAMLKEADIEVTEGVLEEECIELNRRFMTAHRMGRPYVLLKWAQSADGFMASFDEDGNPVATPLSGAVTSVLVHRERAGVDAIMVGERTALTDHPRLDTRKWPSRKNPLRVCMASRSGTGHIEGFEDENSVVLDGRLPLEENLRLLYSRHKVTSIMVEGGAALLRSFLKSGLYDELRVETAPVELGQGVIAPAVRGGTVDRSFPTDATLLTWLRPMKEAVNEP